MEEDEMCINPNVAKKKRINKASAKPFLLTKEVSDKIIVGWGDDEKINSNLDKESAEDFVANLEKQGKDTVLAMNQSVKNQDLLCKSSILSNLLRNNISGENTADDNHGGKCKVMREKYPPTYHAKKDQSFWLGNLLEVIHRVIEILLAAPSKPEFVFKITKKAAHKHFCILAKHNKHLGRANKVQDASPIGYGSKFRPFKDIASIFKHHPNWERMKQMLVGSSAWPTEELDEE
eukprot:12885897-Ditylum_brightwellii.AAC.1